jgi:hypothetical protein
MASTKTASKTIKATRSTRRVAEESVPAELRHLYRESNPEEVSLDLTTEATEDEEPEERERLFTVDGKEYTIPVTFGPGVGLLYLDRIGEGRDVALGEILKTVIGEDGWQALLKLARLNRISVAQMQTIMGKVMERTLGALEGNEGN